MRVLDLKKRTFIRKSRCSEEQIIGILWECEAGASVTDLSHRHVTVLREKLYGEVAGVLPTR